MSFPEGPFVGEVDEGRLVEHVCPSCGVGITRTNHEATVKALREALGDLGEVIERQAETNPRGNLDVEGWRQAFAFLKAQYLPGIREALATHSDTGEDG